jgi:hypothetical protein
VLGVVLEHAKAPLRALEELSEALRLDPAHAGAQGAIKAMRSRSPMG